MSTEAKDGAESPKRPSHAESPDQAEAAEGTPADTAVEGAADGSAAGQPAGSTDAVIAEGRSRRFPSITRTTARPEGGGRAVSGGFPAPARQWPVITVLGLTGLGLLLTALDVFRIGTLLVGVALLVGAGLRWSLPSVGMLAVRSRFTDMATYLVLGTAIVLLSLMAQPDPWLELPFLDDTLHFTIS